jgi:hypothetical protein
MSRNLKKTGVERPTLDCRAIEEEQQQQQQVGH